MAISDNVDAECVVVSCLVDGLSVADSVFIKVVQARVVVGKRLVKVVLP